MTNSFTQLKKTLITVPILVQDSGSVQLEALGVSLSLESKIKDADTYSSHMDVSAISHIESYRDNNKNCWATVNGLTFLVNLTDEELVLIINNCMLKHGSMDVPFAIFDANQVLREMRK